MKGLLPKGVKRMSANEFIELTCFNRWRSELYNEALRQLADFCAGNSIRTIDVDGPFLEEEPYPPSIDIVIELTEEDYAQIFSNSNPYDLWRQKMKDYFRCNINLAMYYFPDRTYCGPEGLTFSSALEYWYWKFSYSIEGYEKGIARLDTVNVLMEVAND